MRCCAHSRRAFTVDAGDDAAWWLKKPPLTAEKNPLLGRWTRKSASQANSSDPFAALAAMAKGGLCEMFFGDGVFEFRPTALIGIDRGGHQQELDQVEYRGDARQVAVIPKTTFKLMVFDFDGPDRINWQGQNCAMVRVNAAAGAASAAPAAARPVPATARPETPQSAASAAAAPADKEAVLSLAAGFGSANGFNPLVGSKFMVLRHSAEAALTKAGFHPTAGMSTYKAWQLECQRGTPACKKGADGLRADGLGILQTDAKGTARTPPLAVGTYYVFGSARQGEREMYWDLRVELKPGANAITLDQRNASPMK